MHDPTSFAGRHVFVAGGSSGINLGIAQAFARAGAHVTVMSRSPDKVQQAAEGLRALGAQALGISADVRDPAAVDAALRQAHAQFGEIDVLISGAAGNFIAPAADLSPNGFKTVIDIDLNGSFHVLRLAYPLLKKPGASVINISAPQGVNPTMYQVHACAAKAGIDMMTRVLAMEWGEVGVRVNAIAPGPIGDTEGMRRLAPTPEALAHAVATVAAAAHGHAGGHCQYGAVPVVAAGGLRDRRSDSRGRWLVAARRARHAGLLRAPERGMSQAYERIVFDVQGGVATLTLSNPAKRNAFDPAMRVEMAEVVRQVQADSAIRALVLTGAGRAFLLRRRTWATSLPAGWTTAAGASALTSLHDWLKDLMLLDKPVVAAVDGAAYGRGLQPGAGSRLHHCKHPRALCDVVSFRVGVVPGLRGLLHPCRAWWACSVRAS